MTTARLANLGAFAILVLAPLVLLGPCLFGDRVFSPFDPARFPPAATAMSSAELQEITGQASNQDVTEIPLLVAPELQLADAEIDAGRFPSWNPYARFGGPLFANGLAGIAYPPNWPLLLNADPVRGLALGAYLGYAIAGLLMFAFLRACQLGALTALFGALAFALSGTMTANAHFYMRMNALIWLPGMLLACLRLERTSGYERIPSALGLALCMALSWLAGFPPFALAATGFTALFALVLVGRDLRRAGMSSAVQFAGWIAAAAILGLIASSVQLAPLFAYFPESSRDLDPGPNTIARSGFDVMGFLGYLMPTAFGEPDPLAQGNAYDRSPVALLLSQRTYWEDADPARLAGRLMYPSNYNFTEYTIFVGALPLLLGVIGIAHRPAFLRFTMLCIGALFALVAVAPSWLRGLYTLPGLETPMRYIAPVALAVATLAAIGFDACARGRTRRVVMVVAGCSVAFAALCGILAPFSDRFDLIGSIARRFAHLLPAENPEQVALQVVGPDIVKAGSARLTASLYEAAVRFSIAGISVGAWAWIAKRSVRLSRMLGCVIILLTGAELIDFASKSNVTRLPPRSTDTAVQTFLRERAIEHRADGGITIMRAAAHPRDALDLPSGLLFPERVRDLNAYAFVDPWSHRPFLELYGPAQMTRDVWPMAFPDDARLARPLFDLCGVRYVLSSEPLSHAGERVGPQLAGDNGEFFIYERPNPMPRAFVVHALETVADDQAAVQRLIDPSFTPRTVALVTPDTAAAMGTAPSASPSQPRTAEIQRDDPTDVLIHVEPGPPGFLVVADACLRGWSATVNGAPVEIHRGNLFMRVVKIDERGTEVRFRYDAPGLTLGLGLTAAALLTMIFLVLSYIGSRRRLRQAEDSI